jgi:heptosyltransferase I
MGLPVLKSEPRRICVIRTSALGDVVHALAMVNGLRFGFPRAHIAWILHPVPYQVVRHQPAVDRFIVFPRRRGWGSLRRQLAGESYDLCLVPQVSFKASLVAAMVRAPVKLGFDFRRSRELHYFFTNAHLPPRPAGHVFEQYLEFLAYLGIQNYEPRWDLVLTPEERSAGAAFAAGLPGPALGLVVASSSRCKDWPPAAYAGLADAAAARFGLVPVLVGGPGAREADAAREIAASARTPLVMALDGPVRTTMVKLAHCRVVVAPDTGPLHLAVALGVPTVGLYAYSDPRRCGPVKFRQLLVDHYNQPGDDPARPITRRTRPGAMATITVDEVLARIEMALTLTGRCGGPNTSPGAATDTQ